MEDEDVEKLARYCNSLNNRLGTMVANKSLR